MNIGVANTTFNTPNANTNLNASMSFIVRPDLTNGPSVTLEVTLNTAFFLQETFESPDAGCGTTISMPTSSKRTTT